MDKLPKEIVLLIISDFSFKDKFQCALINRKWLVWIRESILYKKLLLCQSPNRYLSALNYFDRTGYGKLVSDLETRDCDSTLLAFLRLPQIFPNLKKLYFNQYTPGENPYINETKDLFYEQQLQKWKQLETIEEKCVFFPITTSLLKSPSTAASIKTISITRYEECLACYEEDTEEHQSLSTIIKYLINSPGLENLKLDNLVLRWEDLNRLYSNAKNLKSLKLKNMFLHTNHSEDEEFDEYEISMEVENNEEGSGSLRQMSEDLRVNEKEAIAESLEFLHIQYSRVLIDSEQVRACDWIRETARRYPNLKHFGMVFKDWEFRPILASTFENDIIECIPHWPKLKSYNAKFGPITYGIVEAMDEANIALETVYIYIFDKDSYDQYTHLINSSQIQSIKKLYVLQNGSHLDSNGSMSDSLVNFIENIPNLEEITIKTEIGGWYRYSHDPSIITRILNKAPLLEILRVPQLLTVPTEPILMNTYSGLVELDIHYCQFEVTLGAAKFSAALKVALDHCPRLEKFTTNVNIYGTPESPEDSAIVFDFKNNLRIKEICIQSTYKSSFKVNRSGQIQYHRHDSKNNCIIISEEEKVIPYISIEVCNQPTIVTSVLQYESGSELD